MDMTRKVTVNKLFPRLPALLALSIFLGSAFLLSTPALCKPEVLDPKVSLVEGDVIRKAPEVTDWADATVGDHLVSGENLKTGIKSKSEIEFASGRMRLYQNSLLVVPQIDNSEENTNDIRHIEVDGGAGIFNILKRGRKKGFTFGTKHIIGGVKGTIFSVRTMINWTEVAVMRGVVEVADRKNPKNKVILKKGEKITFWAERGFGESEEDDETEEAEEETGGTVADGSGSGGGNGGRFGPTEQFKDPDEWDDWTGNYELDLEEDPPPEDNIEEGLSGSDSGDGDNGWTDDCPPENDKSDPITR